MARVNKENNGSPTGPTVQLVTGGVITQEKPVVMGEKMAGVLSLEERGRLTSDGADHLMAQILADKQVTGEELAELFRAGQVAAQREAGRALGRRVVEERLKRKGPISRALADFRAGMEAAQSAAELGKVEQQIKRVKG